MKFEGVQVTNFRNVLDSGWVNANQITSFVGQNESGKSNLFEALYVLNPIIPGVMYSLDEDWPVDQWHGRKDACGKLVCTARFTLTLDEIASLAEAAAVTDPTARLDEQREAQASELPGSASIILRGSYGNPTAFSVEGFLEGILKEEEANAWARANVPKFVYINDYVMSGSQIELDQLKQRLDNVGGDNNRHKLNNEDQTILIILGPSDHLTSDLRQLI